ncbi:MAG: diguanylate cyclase, partial [Actinomycetota bacterium]|nr:diguanylate cyclase [Actinomycetota bacterium]
MTASIVVVCVLIPGWATAQNPLPIKVPETAIEPVDQIIQTVQQQVGSPALGVVDPGAGSGTGEPQTIEPAPAQPVDRPPADRPPADPAPQAGPTQEIPAGGVGSAPSPATSQGSGSASAGHGNGGEAQGGGEPKSDDPAAGQGNGDEAQGGGEPKSDDPAVDAEAGARTEIGRASTQSGWTLLNVVERLVGVVPMPLKIALGMLAALLVLAITGAWRVQRRLALAERRAATDGLTGLPNRRHADEVIERLLAASRRKERPLAVMLFDLDHFKAINDRFGHAIGDDALRATAGATRELLRSSDHVARFGGEEFLVLLPET